MPKFNNNKRSLGGLRQNPRHKDNELAPHGIGRILIHQDVVTSLAKQLQSSKEQFAEASIASWPNRKKLANGTVDEFLTIEINALRSNDIRWWNPEKPSVSTLEDFFR